MHKRLPILVLAVFGLVGALNSTPIPQWGRFEREFLSVKPYANPVQEIDFRVEFRSPSGVRRVVYGFWDAGSTWRVRFRPDETGPWTFRSLASDPANAGLHDVSGQFVCGPPPAHGNRFERHGPIVMSKDGVHLAHADGTPFFWLADTAWNGPLWSTPEDWSFYIKRRTQQGFTAVQWVTTQWRGAPEGDSLQRRAFTGDNSIEVNLDFFRRLEIRHDTLIQSGLLSVPVMLWAIHRGPEDMVNPGVSLLEKDAILLSRYMVGRWNADPVVWILNGDGDYRGEKAARWRAIGRGVFGDVWHAPVTIHPGGLIWAIDGFSDESWLNISGYQSAHGDSEANSRWITTGEPARYWKRDRALASLSLEAPYESPAREGRTPTPDFITRRNHYWSILNAPIVGVTYGASGIWSWSNGKDPVPGHGARVPSAWKPMLDLPAATQMIHLADLFQSIDFWRLQPAPGVLAHQPGKEAVHRFISCAQTPEKDLSLLYTPVDRLVSLNITTIPAGVEGEWFNPRNGERAKANGQLKGAAVEYATPAEGDWVLVLKAK